MTVYYHPNLASAANPAALLAIGDSWFWYPKQSNLLAEVSAVVKPDYSDIMALGYLGAKLEEYLTGRYAKQFARELRPGFLQYYSAVLISGGGNDAVDWGLCLKDNCAGETAPEGCIDEEGLAHCLDDLAGWLLAMINEIRDAYDRNGLGRPAIFTHCYDYALPSGKGFAAPLFNIPLAGPWLAPALDAHLVPADDALRRGVIRVLIDRLAATLLEFDSPAERIYVIDSRNTLDPDTEWDNELHPTGAGFQKIVHGPWLAKLRLARLAL